MHPARIKTRKNAKTRPSIAEPLMGLISIMIKKETLPSEKNPKEYRFLERKKSANANESVRRITDPPMAENISSPLEKMIPITPNNIPTKKKSSIQGR